MMESPFVSDSDKVGIHIQIACSRDELPAPASLYQWVLQVLSFHAREGEILLRLVDLDEIQILNHTYRNMSQSTNVLAFPYNPVPGEPDTGYLGDIVLCGSVILREAGEQGKNVTDHWAHMVVHGALHLLGYDHQTSAETIEMEAVEKEILARLSISDPYYHQCEL